MLRKALSECAGATTEDLHARLCQDHTDLRLATVRSTLHAFQEYFSRDDTGLWHVRFGRLQMR